MVSSAASIFWGDLNLVMRSCMTRVFLVNNNSNNRILRFIVAIVIIMFIMDIIYILYIQLYKILSSHMIYLLMWFVLKWDYTNHDGDSQREKWWLIYKPYPPVSWHVAAKSHNPNGAFEWENHQTQWWWIFQPADSQRLVNHPITVAIYPAW